MDNRGATLLAEWERSALPLNQTLQRAEALERLVGEMWLAASCPEEGQLAEAMQRSSDLCECVRELLRLHKPEQYAEAMRLVREAHVESLAGTF